MSIFFQVGCANPDNHGLSMVGIDRYAGSCLRFTSTTAKDPDIKSAIANFLLKNNRSP